VGGEEGTGKEEERGEEEATDFSSVKIVP